MQRYARALSFALIAFCAFAGYSVLSPESIRRSNADWVFFTIVLVSSPLGVLLVSTFYVANSKQPLLRAPSWNRFSFRWSDDPLQCLRFSTVASAAVLLGASLRLPTTSSVATWAYLSLVAFVFGLAVGSLAVHALYRRRITPS